eukprot:350727-Chlamydomonas_euryale.AAC.2
MLRSTQTSYCPAVISPTTPPTRPTLPLPENFWPHAPLLVGAVCVGGAWYGVAQAQAQWRSLRDSAQPTV